MNSLKVLNLQGEQEKKKMHEGYIQIIYNRYIFKESIGQNTRKHIKKKDKSTVGEIKKNRKHRRTCKHHAKQTTEKNSEVHGI